MSMNFMWVALLVAKRHVTVGTIYSNTMLCFLLVNRIASPDRGQDDHYLRQVRH